MNSVTIFLFIFFSFIAIISGQYYPNYGQQSYPNIPTEIIDVPPGVNLQQRYSINKSLYPPQYKPTNYGYPYPYNYYYPQRHQTFPALPSFQQPKQQPQQFPQGFNQIPKQLFKNPTPEFPNGYYVIPGSQHEVVMPPEGVKVTPSNTTSNQTLQEHPGYVIKQTSQRYQSPNQNPTKITSSTVEYKPFRTVLTRYIDRNGTPIIKLENENGTLTLADKGSTSLSINNGKLEINGVDPSSPTTTTESDYITSEPENATPKDVSSWI